MDTKEECLFSESCINLVVKQTEYFMSAFPSKIVFGECTANGYKKDKHFQFNLFELNKLYFCIFDIITYFANDSGNQIENELIITKLEQNYFFSTKYLMVENILEKIVFGIEDQVKSVITFQLKLSVLELNNFISVLVKLIPSSLCFNDFERIMFEKASKESVSTIKMFKDKSFSRQFVNKIALELETVLSDQILNNLSTTITYYCEIILLNYKFESLVDQSQESDNIVGILKKITHG